MNVTKFSIELTDEQVAQISALMVTRSTKTEAQVLEQIVERGIYTLLYRTERNKKVYAAAKEEREELKELRRMLAAKA